MSTGKFVWYDYNANDVDKALAFYTEVVGWKAQPWDGADADDPYTMFAVGEKSIGGVVELADDAREMGAPPHWLAHITVDDLDVSRAKAEELGATVYTQEEMPEVGRFAILADPTGAVFSMFQPSSDDGGGLSPDTPGAFSWHELYTEDLDGAWDFYTKVFGWKQTDTMEMGEMGEYRMFGPGEDQTLGGMMKKPDEFPMSAWAYYVTVEDIDAAIGRAESKGGTKMFGPNEVPGGGKTAMFTDNQGGVFAFYSPA